MLFYFVESFWNVTLKEIIEDYELNFCHKKCTVETGYNKLPEFTVLFENSDLFHLLGIHKLRTKYRAKTWLKAVKDDKFSLDEFKKSPCFYEVLPRVNNYQFLHDIFYQKMINICILEKDLKKNTMKLSVVFYKNKERKTVVLGLRKDNYTGYFKPVTLHESRHNPYSGVKHTTIRNISWCDL